MGTSIPVLRRPGRKHGSGMLRRATCLIFSVTAPKRLRDRGAAVLMFCGAKPIIAIVRCIDLWHISTASGLPSDCFGTPTTVISLDLISLISLSRFSVALGRSVCALYDSSDLFVLCTIERSVCALYDSDLSVLRTIHMLRFVHVHLTIAFAMFCCC